MRASPRLSLLTLVCVAGAATLVGQTVLVRELMVSFYGTELALAAVLSCWLVFVPLGALGAAVLLRARGAARPETLLYAVAAVIALAVPVGLVLARLARPLLGAGVGEFLPFDAMALGAGVAASVVAFPVGFLFPVASSCLEQPAKHPAGGISRAYVAEALGSAVVGALLSLWLLGRQPTIALAFGAAAALLLVAALTAAGASARVCLASAAALAALLCWSGAAPGSFFWPVAVFSAACCAFALSRPAARAASAACAVCGLAVCLTFLVWGARLDRATQTERWSTFSTFRPGPELDTRYEHVELGELAGEFALVQNGRRTAQFPDPAGAGAEAALILTQHPRPRNVLVIGGGLEGLCQEMLARSLDRLDYVESDPQLAAFVWEHLPDGLSRPLADPRFAAYGYDGRYFVQHLASPAALERGHLPGPGGPPRPPAGAYDLVVITVGDPASAASSRYYTAEFYRELSRALRPGGAAAICGVTGSEDLVRGGAALAYTACIYSTLRSSFRHVVVRAGDRFCFFAADEAGVASSDPRLLVQRFDALGMGPPALRYGLERMEFPPERTQWAAALLQDAARSAPANTDERPVLFTLFLALESHYVRETRAAGGEQPGRTDALAGLLTRVRSGLRASWLLLIAAPAVVLVLLRALAGRRAAVSWSCRFSVFTSGLFGLAAEMLIVYAYQVRFGYVYRDIGVLVGLFMLGIALGGLAGSRVPGGRGEGALLSAECAQAVLILALPVLAVALSFSPLAFMALSPLAGLLTGVEFPLAARLILGSGRGAAGTAATLSAADSLGALVGAATTGLLLVPALGCGQAAALLALAKCASLAGLMSAVARSPRGSARANP